MIIGNGDIANALREVDRDDFIFFASGVSNSQETREEEYAREESLLMQQVRKEKHVVYFSSLSIFYNNNRYTRHKRHIEAYLKAECARYTIIRLGNITWGDNPNTLINFIRNKIKNNEPFEIKDEYRYIIDKDEFLYWIKLIPNWNCEMNITGQRMKVKDVVAKYCNNKSEYWSVVESNGQRILY